MRSTAVQRTRDARAIVLSVALHACAVLVLAGAGRIALQQTAEIADRDAVTRVVTFERRPAPALRAAPPRARPAASVSTAQPRPLAMAAVPSPVRAAHASPRQATRTAVAMRRPRPAVVPSKAPAVRPLPTAAPAVAAAPPAPATEPEGPSPAPTPSPVVAEARFDGLFSENYPPAPNPPEALGDVRRRLPARYRIRVRVDEAGHATAVEFLTPLGDAALTDEVRAALLGVRYIPADCNGLHCEGVFELSSEATASRRL